MRSIFLVCAAACVLLAAAAKVRPDESADLNAKVKAHNADLAQYESALESHNAGVRYYSNDLASYESEVQRLKRDADSYFNTLAEYQNDVKAHNGAVARLETAMSSHNAEVNSYNSEVHWYNSLPAEQRKKFQKDRLDRWKANLDNRGRQLNTEKANLNSRKASLDNRKAYLDAKRRELQATAGRLDGRRAELERRRTDINQRKQELDDWATKINQRASTLNRQWVTVKKPRQPQPKSDSAFQQDSADAGKIQQKHQVPMSLIMSTVADQLANNNRSKYLPKRIGYDKAGKPVYLTYCNAFVQDYAEQAFGYNGLRGKTANQIVELVEGEKDGWKAIEGTGLQGRLREAQRYANGGYLVIVGYKNGEKNGHGHVAVVVPGEVVPSDAWGLEVPQIAQAGGMDKHGEPRIYGHAKLSYGFGKDLKNDIVIYVRKP